MSNATHMKHNQQRSVPIQSTTLSHNYIATSSLTWKMFAQNFNRRCHFLLHDFIVFVLLGARLQPLPWQLAAVEVHKHVAQSLEVVPARLLNAEMRVHRSIASSSCKILSFFVGNVLLRLWVPVLLRQTKVDNEYNRHFLRTAD